MTDEIALIYISAEQQLLKKSVLAKYIQIGVNSLHITIIQATYNVSLSNPHSPHPILW